MQTSLENWKLLTGFHQYAFTSIWNEAVDKNKLFIPYLKNRIKSFCKENGVRGWSKKETNEIIAYLWNEIYELHHRMTW